MDAASIVLSRQGQRLLQIGAALLLFLSLEGFAIPHFAAPHLGVSVHKLAALQSVLLLALGLVWPRLNLGAAISRIAFWLLIYAAFAILAAFDDFSVCRRRTMMPFVDPQQIGGRQRHGRGMNGAPVQCLNRSDLNAL